MRDYRCDEEKVFTTAEECEHIVNWIKEYFVKNGPDSKAIIGISGGKDSTVAAALCVKNGWSPRQLGAEHFTELIKLLQRPGSLTRLARWGQGRIGVRGEVRYWLRVAYHKVKRLVGLPYLEELAG